MVIAAQLSRSDAGSAGGRRIGASALAVVLACLVPALAPGAAHAQATNPAASPGIAPPTRTDLLPPEVRAADSRPTTLTVDGGLERGTCALDDASLQSIKVTLTAVEFPGAEAAAGVDLASTYQPYLGRELPLSVLCDIRARAMRALSDAGYLAAVEIPEQRLAGGRAQLRVVLGRLIALRVRGDAGPSQRVLAGYLQPLVGQPVFNVRDAERALLLANDMPGLDVRLSLRPAAAGQPGELIGEVGVVRQRAQVVFNLQNLGSPQLGRFGGLLHAQLFDLTGLGDATTLSAFSSHDFQEQQTVQLAHDFLAGSSGLKLGGQVTLGRAHPSLGLPGFEVKAETLYTSLRASYPLLRTQAATVTAATGFDLVNQNVRANTALLSRDRVRTGWLRLDVATTDPASIARRGGYTPYEPRTRANLAVELRQGLAVLGANIDCRAAPAACVAIDKVPSRIEQDPTAMLLRADLSGEFRPVPAIAIVGRVQAQMTGDALPAFEELSAGNYSIGRGYDPGAVTGDKGLSGSLEVRLGSIIPRDINAWSLQPYLFLDTSVMRDRDPSQRSFNPDSLVSLGGGLRFAWARGLQGDVSLAVPLRRTDLAIAGNQPRGDVRLLLSLTSRLVPWSF